ncbi:hypothetical protein L1285_16865 [Pseudoalteromonas sp. DL2-H2.2]|uniref:hypothetical protein n=1 Tax=Pseudoalteromonas sp. DL2-H2.2 TaxID=2908889 RepID=UPI001F44AAF7|nr:hypothetical protein [Pseudoalteromonas sp. DL2-H2.2]MCF2909994.1 hypothetical protein [Pseudoalteromonas sp. DL2-H2.2]
MALFEGDIKFKRSQSMEDTPEGGGRITGDVILDGEQNSIFQDISDLDRAYGSVSMMKVYCHVDSANSDKFFGANFAVIQPPADPSVSLTMMTTHSHYDRRKDAKNIVESYLTRASEWAGSLLGIQLAGQRTIRIVQREESRDPDVGEVLALIQNEGQQNEFEQYVKIVDTNREVRPFSTMLNGNLSEFTRAVVTCEISEPLRHTFTGGEPSPVDFNATPCTIRETIVANAAKYYATNNLAQDAALGSMTIQADSIFTQLVPSSRTETPITDVNAVGQVNTVVGSSGQTTFSTTLNLGPSRSLFFGGAVKPSTVKIHVSGTVITDFNSDLRINDQIVGYLDYENGIAQFNADMPVFGTSSLRVEYSPASVKPVTVFSDVDEITAENRGYAFVKNLSPTPDPGTMRISYLAQGKWYVLTDSGAGVLRGSDASLGSGLLDFATGTLQLTLGVLPDADSAIIYQWGTEVATIDRAGDTSIKPWFTHQIEAGKTLTPGSVTITWGDKTASEAGGDGFVEVDYQTAEVKFLPAVLPERAEFIIQYEVAGDVLSEELQATGSRGEYVVTTSGAIQPGTVMFELNCETKSPRQGRGYKRFNVFDPQVQVTVHDDGAGNLVNNSSVTIGTVEYASGTITFSIEFMASVRYSYESWGRVIRVAYSHVPVLCSSLTVVSVKYGKSTAGGVSSAPFNPEHLILEIPRSHHERLIPNALVFELAGRRYFERNGQLYTSIDNSTGAPGSAMGSVSHVNAVVKVSNWQPNEPVVLDVISLNTTLDHTHLDSNVVFRTPGAPLAPQSLTLQVLDPQGVMQSVTADSTGAINNGYITGRVDSQTGVVLLEFSEPTDVTTLRYSCVTYNYLPLDAELIGLDPVRLPSDGRVPVITKGDMLLIHQTEQKILAGSAGQVLDVGHPRLAKLEVLELAQGNYSVDLDAGTVTLGDTVASGDYTLEYRFEDMALAIDVSINGVIRIAKQLSHNYTAGFARVSSLLVAGNMWSRYANLYDQRTWTGEWSDTLIGEPTTAQFNDADYSITLTNLGAISERWAIVFTSNTSFKLIGENVGQIAIGDINTDFSPTNPNTGTPYFTVPSFGWGQGWSTGNVLRFNTHGAIFPKWLIRTVLQNNAIVNSDAFSIEGRGNMNKE